MSSGWQTSSIRGNEGCLELKADQLTGDVYLRNTVTGSVLAATATEFSDFFVGVRAGEFDHLLDGVA